MKRQNKKTNGDIAVVLFETVFFFVAIGSIHAVSANLTENSSAETYIGTIGLLTVRRRLVQYLLLRMLRILAPFLSLVRSGFLAHLFRRERLLPSGTRLLTGLFLCLILYPLCIPHRTGFELQCEINGYRGIRPVQAVMLLADVQKDLKADTLPEEQTVRAETACSNFPYTLHSSRFGHNSVHHNVYEYALTDALRNQPLTQIADGNQKAAAQLCTFSAHTVSLYPHSGFICAFDGGSMKNINDLETLFTLTYSYDDSTLRRSEHPQEKHMRNLTLIIERSGEIIGEISAKECKPEYLASGYNTRVWLEMFYNGKKVRVSNIAEF